jgi:O-antigen ligase
MMRGINYTSTIFLIVLLAWVSLFPAPVVQRYYSMTLYCLSLLFFILILIRKNKLFIPGDIPLWAFIAVIGLNVFFAKEKNTAFKTYLEIMIPIVTIYYIARVGIVSSENFFLLVKTACALSIIVALIGVFESIFAFNPIYEYWIENPFYRRYISSFVRPMSTQLHPPILGSYLLAALPFNCVLLKYDKPLWNFLGRSGIVLCVTVLILTFSRGVFLGFMSALFFYIAIRRKRKLLIASVAFFIIALLFFEYMPYPLSRFGIIRIITGNCGILTEYRFIRCLMSWRMAMDNIFTGLGLRHFRIMFYLYYPFKGHVPYEFMIADNMYLTLLAETGFFGIIGFIMLVSSLISKAIIHVKKAYLSFMDKRSSALILSGFIGLLVNMGGYEMFYWPNIYMIFCIYTGLVSIIGFSQLK